MEHLDERPVGAHPDASHTDSRAARARADRALLQRAHRGDQRARAELVSRFLPLARQLARRYQRAGEPLDDLIQVASLGLLKAIDRFDPSRETPVRCAKRVALIVCPSLPAIFLERK